MPTHDMDSVVECPGDLETRDERPQGRGFKIAIAFSAGLHLLVLVAAARFGFLQTLPASELAKPPMAVTLRQLRPRDPANSQAPGSTSQIPSSALKNSSTALPVTPATDTHQSSVAIQKPDRTPLAVAPDETATTPALDEAGLTQSITNYMTTYRSKQKTTWADACVRSSNPNVKDDCPEQLTDTSSQQFKIQKDMRDLFDMNARKYAGNAQARKNLLATMETMRPLMSADPATTKLARQLYFFAEDQLFFLRGGQRNMTFILSVEERAMADGISFSFGGRALGSSINLSGLSDQAQGPAKPDSLLVNQSPVPAPAKPVVEFKLKPAPLGAASKRTPNG